MSRTDNSQAHFTTVRACPHCGTRVAQKAQTCFFCGAALDGAPRRRINLPWPDLLLFAVIATVIAIWWLRAPDAPTAATAERTRLVTGAKSTPILLADLTANDAPTATPLLPTVTPTETPQPTPTVAVEPQRYTVKAGDTVDAIARQFNSTAADIIQANSLGANARLSVGQVLIVPVPGATGGPGPTATPAGGMLIYTVESGDTLSGIAVKFKSNVAWIQQANNMDAAAILRIGQSLLVPLTPLTPTATPTSNITLQPATPTPTATLVAPALLNPADRSVISEKDAVLLSWTAVGTLKADEWYVVTIRVGQDLARTRTWWTKATTWRLPAEYRGSNSEGVEIVWQVQVRRRSANEPGEPTSPASAERRFTWR